MEFIEEFKQREKERREIAFYCWHNIPIEGIISFSVAVEEDRVNTLSANRLLDVFKPEIE